VLHVTPPALEYEGRETGLATLEKPVGVLVDPVTADGAVVEPEGLAAFAFYVYRRPSPGSGLDIWDDASKSWTPEAAPVVRTPAQLGYQQGDPTPWRGVIVGAGGRDARGGPQYQRAVGGYPLYSVRAFFATKGNAEASLSGPSENFAFVAMQDRNLMVMGPGDGEQPDSATEARMLLRSPGFQTIGRFHIRRDAPGAAVTIDNAAGASIVLHPDGRIELTPAAGQRVVVAGDLETEHITYLPAGGFVKQALP
jgi:hypothetical protein